MNSDSVNGFKSVPTVKKFSKLLNSSTTAQVGTNQQNQVFSTPLNQTNSTEALRHLKQTYHLERRYFL